VSIVISIGVGKVVTQVIKNNVKESPKLLGRVLMLIGVNVLAFWIADKAANYVEDEAKDAVAKFKEAWKEAKKEAQKKK